MKNFESGVLDAGLRAYYKSDSNITNTVNTFLKQNNFSNFSQTEAKAALTFGQTFYLNFQQFNWAFFNRDSEAIAEINNYLSEVILTTDKIGFISEMIDLMSLDIEPDTKALSFVLEAFEQNKIENTFDSAFLFSVNQYSDLDLSDVNNHDPVIINYLVKVAVLRSLNPEWSNTKVFWEASKDIVHIALDVFGVVPVVGEVADLINGAIYAIEGDGVNATLSVASAIPFVGYGSLATKYGLKITASTLGTQIKLVWKITANGIEFGSSSKLRKVLGITSSSLQAHHIIPWAKRTHPAVQKAALSSNAFHMNEALNGIPLNTAFHSGSHPNYSNLVQQYLDAIPTNATPEQAYTAISTLILNIRTALLNNPTTRINELIF
ncbi:AHH domain-containing protein [Gelidibacter algens]|nr:AHH domain-containing protein [Gelidibacter algens]